MLQAKLIQLFISNQESRSSRFARVEKILEMTAGEKERPTVMMLPELWATGFFNFTHYRQESEPLQGETFNRLAPWAEKLRCYLLTGSFIEREGENYYNTTMLIGPDGSLCGSYRKIHLFGYQSEESQVLTAGSDLYLVKNKYGTWGFSTCYDLRFPELYRKLLEAGVDILFVTAAWPLARLEHWLLLNRCRALENLSFVVACNCAGGHGDQQYGGNSLVVNPWGDLLARGGLNEEQLTVAIDLQEIGKIRSTFPALQDRKIR